MPNETTANPSVTPVPASSAAAGPAPAPSGNHAAARRAAEAPKETVKETIISIIIAFVLAFVFRSLVVEAFVIPTGSMAPTLMGAHMRFRGPESGYSWPVGPWQENPQSPGEYLPVQHDVAVHDPMTGQRVEASQKPRRSGDRILVLKFLYGLREPERYDVVVFKCPYEPQTNFIKRLVGLPGEQIALVDGDVFVRDAAAPLDTSITDLWDQPGWRIARKAVPAQEAVWQPVFDSRYAPLNPVRDSRPWYNPPWVGSTAGWSTGGRIYAYDSAAPTVLAWDRKRPRYTDNLRQWAGTVETWDIDDRYPYDEHPIQPAWKSRYPVSDVRLRAGVEPRGEGLEVTATVKARRREFQAVIAGTTARLQVRGGEGAGALAWTTLGEATIPALPVGKVTDVEFWHVDQALQLWIDGACVLTYTYDWSPSERILNATGQTVQSLLDEEHNPAQQSRGGTYGNIFARATKYSHPEVSWAFKGAPLRLHRVGLDRDLHYQAGTLGSGLLRDQPALATHPATTPTLTADEFFCLGDNSPMSRDGRLWDDTDPWVRTIDDKVGVVPRELMLGKAFFVYFPSLHKDGPIPVPDFGRLRFIR